MTKHDLLAEHGSLSQQIPLLKIQIREGLFGHADVLTMRELERRLFEAEDRLRLIERSKTWQRHHGGGEA